MIDSLRGTIKAFSVPREEKIVVAERQFTAILTPDLEEGGYAVTCKEISAAISQGETIQEALDNLADAIELSLEAEAELRKSRVRDGT